VAIVVVGGSGKDVGKTGVVCAVISALREYEWTAVKITGHDYPAGGSNESSAALVIREETRAGEETDTARFLRAGAKRALLVKRVGDEVPMDEIRAALGSDRNVVFESNRILDAVKPDVCLALVGGDERKASFVRLMRAADAVLTVQGSAAETLREGVRRFQLESVDRLPAELLTWLRERLDRVVTPRSEGR